MVAEEHGGVVPEVIRRDGANGDDGHADHGARLDADVRLHYGVVRGEGSERERERGRVRKKALDLELADGSGLVFLGGTGMFGYPYMNV